MVTSTYRKVVADRVLDDINRVEINNQPAEILTKTKLNSYLVELTLRPLQEISSLSSVKVFDGSKRLIYTRTTNVNIQDMYNIELKIRIGVE